MKIQLQISGLQEALQKFRDAPREIKRRLKADVEIAGLPFYSAITTYPNAPARSHYTRSYQYRDTATGKPQITMDTVAYVITTPMPYARYLRGDLEDGYPGAWMHVGRWESLQHIVDRLQPGFARHIQEALDDYIHRVFGD